MDASVTDPRQGWGANQLPPSAALANTFVLPQELLPLAANLPAGANGRTVGQPLQREGFQIGNLCLMIRYEDGSELTEMPKVFRLPNAPAWFLGITNLHGALVSVFDPAEMLGVARVQAHKPMLLVLGHSEEKAALVIDGLPRRLRPAPDHLLEQRSYPPALADCVEGVYQIDGQDWMDFRYPPFFERLESELKR